MFGRDGWGVLQVDDGAGILDDRLVLLLLAGMAMTVRSVLPMGILRITDSLIRRY